MRHLRLFQLKKEYLAACEKCLAENDYRDENLDFPHSLPICILDAVFSIGIRYQMVPKNWKNYITYYNLSIGRMGDFDDGKIDEHEHTINDFVHNIQSFSTIDECIGQIGFTRHRTSPTNGILKLEASLQVAQVMQKHGINTVNDFRQCTNREQLDTEILRVPGQSSGIMLNYLYMLAGDPHKCKPDRWLLRFLQTYYPSIQMQEAEQIMERTAEYLRKGHPNVTVRMLDNAIWKHMADNT